MPWLIFWCLGAASACNRNKGKRLEPGTDAPLSLADTLGPDSVRRIVRTLAACYTRYETTIEGRQVTAGGFCGGPGQIPHLATTYAALAAITCLADPLGYELVNADEIEHFLWDRRIWTVADSPVADPREVGGFTMHDGGECDTRAVYCALAAATFIGRLRPGLVAGAGEAAGRGSVESFLRSTTSLAVGGSGALAGNEAHGGYTFCAIASAHLLGIQLPRRSFESWLSAQQPAFEGGFAGRHNKLVDSCYAFWQGAVGSILAGVIDGSEPEAARRPPCFDPLGLERYVLTVAQDDAGGCRDKPDKYRDLYHTCYALSGLAVAHQMQPADAPPLSSYAASPSSRTPSRNVVLNVPPAALVQMHRAMGVEGH
jgi:protein farnesyltransferase subunit beta